MNKTERLIILRKTEYKDSDLIMNGLTESGNSLSFIARGARKSNKRFGGGVLEPTHFIKATLSQKNSESTMWTLKEATLLESFPGLRKDYDALEASLFLLKFFNKLSYQGLINARGCFHILGRALRALENAKHIEALKIHFLSHLLKEQGVFPDKQPDWSLQKDFNEHAQLPEMYKSDWQSYKHAILSSTREYFNLEI